MKKKILHTVIFDFGISGKIIWTRTKERIAIGRWRGRWRVERPKGDFFLTQMNPNETNSLKFFDL